MKHILPLIVLVSLNISSQAQLVPCRQKISMVCYEYHDDRNTNRVMDSILVLMPDILIDNTPGGFWGRANGRIGCLPLLYTRYGIEVYSYITGGYENTRRGGDTALIDSNLARINTIASDSATGVFLDEVSHHPDAAGKAYIDSIFRRCRAKGLKLILNTGVYSSFDPWLMSHCDYLMTDENYNGRAPSISERPYLDSILVVTQGVTRPTQADSIAKAALINGFGYYYACDAYIHVPSWVRTFSNLIVGPPIARISMTGYSGDRALMYTGTTVSLDSVVWYFGDGQRDTGMSVTHRYPGMGYFITKVIAYSPCGTDTAFTNVDVPEGLVAHLYNNRLYLYPNPTSDDLFIGGLTDNVVYNLLTATGTKVAQGALSIGAHSLSLAALSPGVYVLQLVDRYGITNMYRVTKL